MALLAKWLIPTPEVRSSNPVICPHRSQFSSNTDALLGFGQEVALAGIAQISVVSVKKEWFCLPF